MSKDAKTIQEMKPAAPEKTMMDKVKAYARTGGCIVVWLALAAVELPMKSVAKEFASASPDAALKNYVQKNCPGDFTEACYQDWATYNPNTADAAAKAEMKGFLDAAKNQNIHLNYTSNMNNWWQLAIISAICLPMCFAKFGMDGVKQAFSMDQLKLFGPTSLCFAAARMFKQPTQGMIPPDLEKVISGLETVLIAGMFFAAGRHHYSMAQWACLACVPVVVVGYALIKTTEDDQKLADKQIKWLGLNNGAMLNGGEDGKGPDYTAEMRLDDSEFANLMADDATFKTMKNPFIKDSKKDNLTIGLLLMAGYLLCMLGGTFFGEVAFKKKMPFLVQKSTDAVIGLIFFTFLGTTVFPFMPKDNDVTKVLRDDAMWFKTPDVEKGENPTMKFLWGWTGPAAITFLFLMIAKQVMSNILVKYLDSTVKQICKTLSTTLVYGVTFLFGWEKLGLLKDGGKWSMLNFTGVMAVTFVVGSYVVATMYTKNKAQWRKMAKDLKAMQEGPAEELPEEAKSAEKAKLLPK